MSLTKKDLSALLKKELKLSSDTSDSLVDEFFQAIKATLRSKKNLKLSTIEGCFWAAMYGGGETFLSACAVFLQFSPFQISFLSSFPPFIGSCFQLFSSIIKNKFKDIKQFVVKMSYLQARENNYELKNVLYTGYDFTLYRSFIQEGYRVE